MTYYIYTYTNKDTHKVYVGRTVDWKRRHIEHRCQKNKHSYIDMAIRKHGLDAFDYRIIEEWDTQEEANEAEAAAIRFYECIAPYGYNIALGGQNAPKNREAVRKGAETRKRNGSVRGENNPWSVLTQDKANYIRGLRRTGMTLKAIAIHIGVSTGCVNHIIHNRTWVQS